MNNISALPGASIRELTGAPNTDLVQHLQTMIEQAKTGELRCFIGTGFTAAGHRISLWCDTHANVYEMRGSLAWLEAEYMHRHTS